MKNVYKFLKSNIIIFIALGGFVYFISVAFSGDNSKTDAWVLAKHEVELKLKSPSSAKFPSMNEAKISEYGDTYIITSYVDADNSFGAKVRSEFTVTLKKNDGGDYIVEYVYIE